MKQRTKIIETNTDQHLFTLDYLYAPYQSTFNYKWQDQDGWHNQQYTVVGVEEEIFALSVTRTLYVLPLEK